MNGMGGIIFDFFPYIVHKGIYSPGGGILIITPYLVEYGIAINHFSLMSDKKLKQSIFFDC